MFFLGVYLSPTRLAWGTDVIQTSVKGATREMGEKLQHINVSYL